MKKILITLSMVAGFGFASSSFAQSCAAPLPIGSAGSANAVKTGDTCTATNQLSSFGLVPSPQNDIIYSFVAQSANATIALSANAAAWGGTVYLMPSPCADATDIINGGNSAAPMAVTGLTNGATYYVIMSGDPGGAANACGPFTLTVTGTLPVSLQGFSVE